MSKSAVCVVCGKAVKRDNEWEPGEDVDTFRLEPEERYVTCAGLKAGA